MKISRKRFHVQADRFHVFASEMSSVEYKKNLKVEFKRPFCDEEIDKCGNGYIG